MTREQSSSAQPLQLAVIQFKGQRDKYEECKRQLLALISEVAQEGARLIVAPEMACSEYLFADAQEALPFAETSRGDLARTLVTLSERFQTWCVFGVIELGEGDRLFNSAFITSPTGQLVTYRKRLLFDADHAWAYSGDEYPHSLHEDNRLQFFGITPQEGDLYPPYPLFDVYGWRMTVGICMDLNDQRFLDFCAHAGVDLIAFPTNWLEEGLDVLEYWAYLLSDIQGVTLLAANSYGAERDISFCGGSAILQSTSPPVLLGQAPSEGNYFLMIKLKPHSTASLRSSLND